jgi:hypothetical protein
MSERAWRDRAKRLLAHRRWPWLAGLLALLLALPSAWRGLFADDYFQRAGLLGSHFSSEFVSRPLDIFAFVDGDPAHTHRLMDMGFMPWWAYPAVKAGFWRPLTVLTHWLDYHLWPDQIWLMHLQSVAWYAALVIAVAVLYRRVIPVPWVAGLAALAYAVDYTHALPVAFLANRNALLSTLFGVLALVAHDRWRRDGRRLGAVLGPGLFLLSLLAKEEGVGTCAYLAAYALFLDRWVPLPRREGAGGGFSSAAQNPLPTRPLRGGGVPVARRLLTLAPYAIVLVVWRLIWSGLGYGVAGVGFYVDPLREPLRYLAAVVQRAPYLLLGQWTGPPAETCILEQVVGVTLIKSLWWAGIGVAILLAAILWPLLRRDATARFWAAGMVLALLPVCATFPADRLLLFPGLGAMGLLAQFLALVFASSERLPSRKLMRAAGGVLIAIHLVIAPIALPVLVSPQTLARLVARTSMRVPLDESVTHQDVIVINPPSLLYAVYFPLEREAAGLPVPRRVRFLSSGVAGMTIQRTDAYSLVIGVEGGYIGWSFERLFRDERHPMHVGERVALTGMTATVTAITNDGRPAEAAFRFAVPLEDASLRWIWWHDGEFRPFTPPAVGETVQTARERVPL